MRLKHVAFRASTDSFECAFEKVKNPSETLTRLTYTQICTYLHISRGNGGGGEREFGRSRPGLRRGGLCRGTRRPQCGPALCVPGPRPRCSRVEPKKLGLTTRWCGVRTAAAVGMRESECRPRSLCATCPVCPESASGHSWYHPRSRETFLSVGGPSSRLWAASVDRVRTTDRRSTLFG